MPRSHQKLKVGTVFADWIRRRIADFKFEEDRDYFSNLRNQNSAGRGGDRRSIEYHLTLDMAKELAMLERNEVGRSIRRYFIQKEKEARRPMINFNPLEGFKQKDFLTGLKPFKINDQKLWPYREVIKRIGYSPRSGAASRKRSYGQHFMKVGETLYITEEFAQHLAHSRAVYVNRERMKNAQPLLPFNFGDATGLLGQKGGGL